MQFKARWPEGSLEKTLKAMGVSSLKDALAKQIKPKAEEQTQPSNEGQYLVMVQAIEDISKELEDFNLDDLSMHDRERLALMPLRTDAEVLQWKKAWLDTLVKARW